jgi:hypothetical protein
LLFVLCWTPALCPWQRPANSSTVKIAVFEAGIPGVGAVTFFIFFLMQKTGAIER